MYAPNYGPVTGLLGTLGIDDVNLLGNFGTALWAGVEGDRAALDRVHGRIYSDPELFAEEMRSIFGERIG